MNKFRNLIAIATLVFFAVVGCSLPGREASTSAFDYVILAKSAVSNVPTSSVKGNIGLSPGRRRS